MNNLEEIRQTYPNLAEILENILVNESLLNDTYYSIKSNNKQITIYINTVKFNSKKLLFKLEIPIPVSKYNPPYVNIDKKILENIDIDKFEKETFEKGIVIIKHEPSKRGFGYVVISGGKGQISQSSRWQFMFPEYEKLYEFYVLCKQYDIF